MVGATGWVVVGCWNTHVPITLNEGWLEGEHRWPHLSVKCKICRSLSFFRVFCFASFCSQIVRESPWGVSVWYCWFVVVFKLFLHTGFLRLGPENAFAQCIWQVGNCILIGCTGLWPIWRIKTWAPTFQPERGSFRNKTTLSARVRKLSGHSHQTNRRQGGAQARYLSRKGMEQKQIQDCDHIP